jgi:hypothetical protein
MFRLVFALPLLATLSAALRFTGRAASCPSNSVVDASDFTLTAISKANSINTHKIVLAFQEEGNSYLVSQLRILIPFFTRHGDADEHICVQAAGNIDGSVGTHFSMASGTVTASNTNDVMKSYSEPVVNKGAEVLFTPLNQQNNPPSLPGPFCVVVSPDHSTSLE